MDRKMGNETLHELMEDLFMDISVMSIDSDTAIGDEEEL